MSRTPARRGPHVGRSLMENDDPKPTIERSREHSSSIRTSKVATAPASLRSWQARPVPDRAAHRPKRRSSKPAARPAAAAIERAPGRRQRRVEVHPDPRAVHPDWATRHPKGQHARPRRDRVHPPGQPCWRPDLDTHVAVATKVQTLDGQLVGLARLGEEDDGMASRGG
jgi:hypothetical protein